MRELLVVSGICSSRARHRGTAGSSQPSLYRWSGTVDQVTQVQLAHLCAADQVHMIRYRWLTIVTGQLNKLLLTRENICLFVLSLMPGSWVTLYTRPVEISYNLHWIPGGNETSVGIPLDEYLGALPHKPFASTQKQSVLQKKSFRVSLLPCVPQLIFFHRSLIKFAVLGEGGWMGPVIQTIATPNPRLYFTFRC